MTDSRNRPYELAVWGLFSAALLGLLAIDLLPAFLAGLLIYSLVHALVKPLRIPALGVGGPRLLAVTLIALLLLTGVTYAGLSATSFSRSSTSAYESATRWSRSRARTW